MVTEPGNYTERSYMAPSPAAPPAASPPPPHKWGGVELPWLARPAAAGAQALDLASLGRRDVVRTASHLAHESLFLHLAAELAQSLFELLGILDDYPHNPSRIQAGQNGLPGKEPARGRRVEASGEKRDRTAPTGFVTDGSGLGVDSGQRHVGRVRSARVDPGHRDGLAGLMRLDGCAKRVGRGDG